MLTISDLVRSRSLRFAVTENPPSPFDLKNGDDGNRTQKKKKTDSTRITVCRTWKAPVSLFELANRCRGHGKNGRRRRCVRTPTGGHERFPQNDGNALKVFFVSRSFSFVHYHYYYHLNRTTPQCCGTLADETEFDRRSRIK